MSVPAAPMGLLAEMTHRCPLQCPYCSNPLNLDRVASELGTGDWLRVLEEAAALGVLQVHFSGGEPLIRRDMPELVKRAAELNLYSNIITSGVLLDDKMMRSLSDAGRGSYPVELPGFRSCRKRQDRQLSWRVREEDSLRPNGFARRGCR